MRPAILSVLLIMYIRAIDTFEVPAIVGVPAKIPMFTTKIFLALHQFPKDFGLAGAYATCVMILSVGGILLYRRATEREVRYAPITDKGYRPRLIDLGPWRYVTLASACLIFFVAFILPFCVLLWSSLIPYYGIPSKELFAKLTLDNYRYLFIRSDAWLAFKNSIYLSIGSATLTMLLTSVIAWFTVRAKIRGKGLLEGITFFPIAIPGIVLGVSLLWVYVTIPILIYGTLWILLIAYITRYMPYGIWLASAPMALINKELEEASMASRASWWQNFRRVIIPLLMPGFIVGWLYISIVSLKELSPSILLYTYSQISIDYMQVHPILW